MHISKKFLSDIGELNKNAISWAIEVKTQLALIDRTLNVNEDGDVIDDIAPEEIQAGTQAVKEYCLSNDCTNLYYEYALNTASESEKLNIIKEKKKFEIQTERDAALESGFTFKEHTFQTREKDKLNINGMAANILLDMQSGTNSITEITWIDLNDEKVNFTPQEFLTFVSKVAEYTQEIIFKANVLKEKINSAKTVKAVDKIKWE